MNGFMTARLVGSRSTSSMTLVALGVATATAGMFLNAGAAFAAPKGSDNGTVKVAELGDLDGKPQNDPHVGCTFKVQWFNFDEGKDLTSKVSFALQSPTEKGVTLDVKGPAEVFVGEDAAGGADKDLDAEATYTLAFTGEPQEKQGYHVKLSVETAGSDGKSKVFWVDGCRTDEPTTPTEEPTRSPPRSPPRSRPRSPPTRPRSPPTSPPTSPPSEPTDEAAQPADEPRRATRRRADRRGYPHERRRAHRRADRRADRRAQRRPDGRAHG